MNELFSITVTENETAVLKCQLVANPKPIIKWFKNENFLIQDSKDYIYLEEPNNIYKLVIRVLKYDNLYNQQKYYLFFLKEPIVEDAGFYKIVASNPFGISSSTCKLTVQEG